MSSEVPVEKSFNLAERTSIGIVPKGPRVIIRRFQADEKIGSIIIPTIGMEPPAAGVIVAIGDGQLIESEGYRIPCGFDLGQSVFFGKYSGAAFNVPRKTVTREVLNGLEQDVEKLTEDEYLIMHESEVLAVDLRDETLMTVRESK